MSFELYTCDACVVSGVDLRSTAAQASKLQKSARSPRAFTLIEMLVVLALSAILAGIVTVSLAGSFHTSRVQDVAGNLATYDRLSREYFRKFGLSGSLVFDLGRGTVRRIAAESPKLNSKNSDSAPIQLPSEFHLSQVITCNGTTTSGEVSIPCSAVGQTTSYALGLTDDTGRQYWTLTAGLTGRSIQVDNEQEVHDIFQSLAGNDAR